MNVCKHCGRKVTCLYRYTADYCNQIEDHIIPTSIFILFTHNAFCTLPYIHGWNLSWTGLIQKASNVDKYPIQNHYNPIDHLHSTVAQRCNIHTSIYY